MKATRKEFEEFWTMAKENLTDNGFGCSYYDYKDYTEFTEELRARLDKYGFADVKIETSYGIGVGF